MVLEALICIGMFGIAVWLLGFKTVAIVVGFVAVVLFISKIGDWKAKAELYEVICPTCRRNRRHCECGKSKLP